MEKTLLEEAETLNHEIRERRKAENEALEANQAKSIFLAKMVDIFPLLTHRFVASVFQAFPSSHCSSDLLFPPKKNHPHTHTHLSLTKFGPPCMPLLLYWIRCAFFSLFFFFFFWCYSFTNV
mgnify:FL=1